MSSVYVVVRRTKAGKPRYHVRARLAGRYSRVLHLGAFGTRREATLCADWAKAELAQGRVPDRIVRIAETQMGAHRTVAVSAREWLASRHDLTPGSVLHYAARIKDAAQSPVFRLPVARVTVDDVQAFVREQAESERAVSTIRRNLHVLRAALDYAQVDPNPARDRRVRLPRATREEIQPPSAREVRLILEHAPKRWRLLLALLEATGLRISEALSVTFADVDADACRLRVQSARSKSRRSRYVPVPRELLELVVGVVPLEDRTAERRLFPGMTREGATSAMRFACKLGGIPLYSPHDLRHRAISRWLHSGMSILTVAAQAGHSRPSLTTDVYGHVNVDGDEAWRWVLHADSSIVAVPSDSSPQ